MQPLAASWYSKIPRRWLYVIALVILLAAFVLLQLSLLERRSMMVDDAIHIPSGYSYVKTHDFRLNAEHPPFIKVLSGLGLEHVAPELPLDSEGWSQAQEPGDPDDGTNAFSLDFFHRNADKFEQLSYWGRLPVIFVPMVLAIVVWSFARVLFGDLAAILSVFFLLTEPNIIANSNFVQDDLASALAVMCFVLALRAYFLRPVFLRALLFGLAVALALLVKHSLVALVPIAVILLVVHMLWRRIKYKEHLCRHTGLAVVILGVAYFVFIAGYAFDVSFIDDDEAVFISEWFNVTGGWSESFQNLLVHLPVLLPKYYLWGMDLVVNDLRGGRPAFLFGNVSDQGWWYYFPVAFVLKTTIPFLLLTISGIAWAVWETAKRRWRDGLYLLLPVFIYLILCMASHLNIGVRHMIPVFPFFAVMGAAAVSAFLAAEKTKRWRLPGISIGVLAIWIGLTVVMTFPQYTTYFSPIAGGPSNGWRLLSDSNVETGQDAKSVAEFLKQRGESRVEDLFVGSGFLEFYGIDNCDLPCSDDQDNDSEQNDGEDGDEPTNVLDMPEKPMNYTAIGAWYLQEINLTPEQKIVIDRYRSSEPEAVIGNAIFVFRRQTD